MKKKVCIIILVVFLTMAAPLLLGVTGILCWSKIACRYDMIDIDSGMIRSEYWYYYINVLETNKNSNMSSNISPLNGHPNWKKVNCFSPGLGHSPHYSFHGAIYQLRQIEQFKEYFELDEKQVVKMFCEVRDAWIKDDNYHGADKILKEYWMKHVNDE